MEEFVLNLMDDRRGSECLRAHQLFTMPDLTVFTDLDTFSLLNIYGDLLQWRNQVVQVLRNSPNLQSLGLSLSVDALSWHSSFTLGHGQYWGWFDSLCKSYIETGGLSPRYGLCFAAQPFPRRTGRIWNSLSASAPSKNLTSRTRMFGRIMLVAGHDHL